VTVVGMCLVALGAALLVLAAWGVVRLPDALSRQHAATKAGTLALAFIAAGAALMVAETAWSMRLGLIVAFLLVTLPVASHLLARAAVREAGHEEVVERAPLVGDDPATR
jgi:multicomponent Na+:H+ antiporter subunit G